MVCMIASREIENEIAVDNCITFKSNMENTFESKAPMLIPIMSANIPMMRFS